MIRHAPPPSLDVSIAGTKGDAWRLTLTSLWEAGIEENTYLVYVFAKRAGYAVAA
jgi:hypothetical protein